MTTSTDIVNQAIQYMGNNQPPVTGVAPNFDSSTAGKAAQALYVPCIQTVIRQFGWDFARAQAALATTAQTPVVPWKYEFFYPTNGIQILQILPAASADPNNPLPLTWSVGNKIVNGTSFKVVWTNLTNLVAFYTLYAPEGLWDPGFREAVVRLLAAEMAMALDGKPDTAQTYTETGSAFENIAQGRSD